jgi:hypothetical protein
MFSLRQGVSPRRDDGVQLVYRPRGTSLVTGLWYGKEMRMTQFKDAVRFETCSATPIVVGDTKITPQAQSLSIRWPRGEWVWNRPVGVLVERNGQTERIPIVDVTRVAQWTLLGITVALWLLSLTRMRVRSEQERKGLT